MDGSWTITRAFGGASPLVVHVPHAGTWIPADDRADLLLDDAGLAGELARMTDWHTDTMATDALARAAVPGSVFANRASRLLVDPERFTGDEEPMRAVGMGPVYVSTSQRAPLRAPDATRDARLLARWFIPYAEAFTGLVDRVLADHGSVTIVDLHSFPSVALPYEADPAAARPSVCIGTDPFHTPPGLEAAVRDALAAPDRAVGTDTPFAGTYVPLPHLHRTPAVRSVMVEVRRDLYQSEPGGPVHAGYDRVVDDLASLFRTLVGGGTG
jgi:N-formylglutamate deformylase